MLTPRSSGCLLIEVGKRSLEVQYSGRVYRHTENLLERLIELKKNKQNGEKR